MSLEDGTREYDHLQEDLAGRLAGEDFSLEDILAEFGAVPEEDSPSAEERPADRAASREESGRRSRRRGGRRMEAAPEPEPEPESEPEIEPEPEPAPRSYTLEDVVGRTVRAALAEKESRQYASKGRFSRRKEDAKRSRAASQRETVRLPREEFPGERELADAAETGRLSYLRGHRVLPFALVLAILPTLLILLEQRSGTPVLPGSGAIRGGILLGILAAEAALCAPVFRRGIRMLTRGRVTAELMASLTAAVTALDCAAYLIAPARGVQPYVPVCCWTLFFSLLGVTLERRAVWDTFRTAAMDPDPPYLVTETAEGACKQRGRVDGFYTTARHEDFSTRLQAVVLPVVLVGSLVYAGLHTLGRGQGGEFALQWSVILAAGTTFSLPLCWSLSHAALATRLQKSGCALAGWDGAVHISREKRMVLTDTDIFPPGTVQLNGVKVYGEKIPKVAAYAAALTRAARCGLDRIFEELALGESAEHEEAELFSFHADGGFSAVIHGEDVLLGPESFMRRRGVALPDNIRMKTGVFLAIDSQLAAVFAVRYDAAENVDYALHVMRQSKVMPILATRDPVITPTLVQFKFDKNAQMEYPDLPERVALSEAEEGRGVPRALVLREGLLPYAEAVVGSLRLCTAVRRATILSLAGSVAGTLLSAYMVSLGMYSLISPLMLTLFLLLWLLPVLLISRDTGRF